MANNAQFPETGYEDCNLNNNVLSAKDCRMLIVSIAGADSICTGTTTQLMPDTGGMWVSSDTLIAKVTNNGVVTGVSTGSATFTYTSSATGCFNTTNAVTVDTFPKVNPITAVRNVVCENEIIQLTGSPVGGSWKISNSNNIQINGSTANNPVNIQGKTPGKSFISYTVGSGTCKSTATFLLKIISNTPPQIRMGFER
jgi:uncharacterized protein YjdB